MRDRITDFSMAKMSITTGFFTIFLVSIICASLTTALSLDISDLKTNGNYTTNEICYIRYYGVSIYEEDGNKAYGIKEKPEDRASPLMLKMLLRGHWKTTPTCSHVTSL